MSYEQPDRTDAVYIPAQAQSTPQEAVQAPLTAEQAALVAKHHDDQDTASSKRAFLLNARAKREAADQDRAERMDALTSGVLSEASAKYLASLHDASLDDLDSIPDPIPVVGRSHSDGLLFRGTVNYLAGASGSYKTIIALDLAARVGAGLDFCGMPVTRGRALYIIAEGLGGMKFRKRSWEDFHNLGHKMENVMFIPFAVQIPDLAVEMPALIAFAKQGGYDFIIFDTQAMCTVGVDEIKNDEMTVVLSAAQTLATETNGCVLIVAHTGKDEGKGIRGASSQYANVNTVIAVSRKGSEEAVTLSTARAKDGKQKDAKEIEAMRFTIEKVGHSVVLDGGTIDTIAQKFAGLPSLSGKYDADVLAILVGHDTLGATKTEMQSYLADAGITTSSKSPVLRKTVGQVIDRLAAEKMITPGPKFRLTDLGKKVLYAAEHGDEDDQ